MASSARDKGHEVASSLSNLKLDGPKMERKPSRRKEKKEVADSWEDEDSPLSGDEAQTPYSRPSPSATSPHHAAPDPDFFWNSNPEPVAASPRNGPPSRRPEKTDAVARRMIAAGLGLKAPKQTEEQRAYQKSIREQETKRRDEEKAEEQKQRDKVEKAKEAIWND